MIILKMILILFDTGIIENTANEFFVAIFINGYAFIIVTQFSNL